MNAIKECCGNCKFHQMNVGDMKVVLCRRYPPTPFMVPQGPGRMGQMVAYPQVPSGWWCGEYKPTFVLETSKTD